MDASWGNTKGKCVIIIKYSLSCTLSPIPIDIIIGDIRNNAESRKQDKDVVNGWNGKPTHSSQANKRNAPFSSIENIDGKLESEAALSALSGFTFTKLELGSKRVFAAPSLLITKPNRSMNNRLRQREKLFLVFRKLLNLGVWRGS